MSPTPYEYFKENQKDSNDNINSSYYIDKGIKHDSEKIRMDLLPWDALEKVAEVLTYGAKKYKDNGWREVESTRYVGALLRHLSKHLQGEIVDSESGLRHIDHVACNALFLVVKADREGKTLPASEK